MISDAEIMTTEISITNFITSDVMGRQQVPSFIDRRVCVCFYCYLILTRIAEKVINQHGWLLCSGVYYLTIYHCAIMFCYYSPPHHFSNIVEMYGSMSQLQMSFTKVYREYYTFTLDIKIKNTRISIF
jgi:hypothetical protein